MYLVFVEWMNELKNRDINWQYEVDKLISVHDY